MKTKQGSYMSDTKKYEPLLEAADEEKTAAGKCRWIIEVLRLLCTNEMPHLCTDVKNLTVEFRKQTNRVMILVAVLLIIVLITNPQVGKFLGMIFKLVF